MYELGKIVLHEGEIYYAGPYGTTTNQIFIRRSDLYPRSLPAERVTPLGETAHGGSKFWDGIDALVVYNGPANPLYCAATNTRLRKQKTYTCSHHLILAESVQPLALALFGVEELEEIITHKLPVAIYYDRTTVRENASGAHTVLEAKDSHELSLAILAGHKILYDGITVK